MTKGEEMASKESPMAEMEAVWDEAKIRRKSRITEADLGKMIERFEARGKEEEK